MQDGLKIVDVSTIFEEQYIFEDAHEHNDPILANLRELFLFLEPSCLVNMTTLERYPNASHLSQKKQRNSSSRTI